MESKISTSASTISFGKIVFAVILAVLLDTIDRASRPALRDLARHVIPFVKTEWV